MLCKITMISKRNITLPFSYNSIIQAVLYRFINEEAYGQFMHNKGYTYNKRSFKLFSFSSISKKPVSIDKEHKKFVFSNEISFYVSSINNEFFNFVLNSIVNMEEILNLGGNDVSISRLDIIEQDTSVGGIVKTLSPITVYSTFEKPAGGKVIHYYSPYELEFAELVRNNLLNKYRALYENEPENSNFTIKAKGRVIEKVIPYKSSLVKGYSGMFDMEGSPELIGMAFCSGLGSKNSQGFGLIVRPDNKQSGNNRRPPIA